MSAHITFARGATFAAIVFSLSLCISAQGLPWSHPDGTNHWYGVVQAPAGITWDGAHDEAIRRGANLATITSQGEADFVAQLVDSAQFWTRTSPTAPWVGPWIGGVQPPGAIEPAGGWHWVSTEPFSFAAWTPGQPDNKNANEDRIHFGGSTAGRVSTWADAPQSSAVPVAFVVEYDNASVPQTIGLLRPAGRAAYPGYTLYHPRGKQTLLIDDRGRTVHAWPSSSLGLSSGYLLDNGDLLRTTNVPNATFGGRGGKIERVDWNGKVLWSFVMSTTTLYLHHDVELLPNGNVLAIVWVLHSAQDALANGRDPSKLTTGIWSEKVIEIKPTGPTTGQIVWEWRVWDHLIQDYDPSRANHGPVNQHPERIDFNYDTSRGRPDWLHLNAIDYNPVLDQIVISPRAFHEIWVIDHSTTTAEAASSRGGRWGKGGDLLYRWGNPAAYRAGTVNDQQLIWQHNPQWIPPGYPGAGNLTIFNNGPRPGAGGKYSTVDEIKPPQDVNGNYVRTGPAYGPATPTWSYRAPVPTTFFSAIISGAQRLPNGNTLVCSGHPVARLFEVDAQGNEVWRYVCPTIVDGSPQPQGGVVLGGWAFRCTRYPASHPALVSRTLTPRDPAETYRTGLLVEGARVPHRARLGTLALFTLFAKTHAGYQYLLASSIAAGPIRLDHRAIAVGMDPIFFISLLQVWPTTFLSYAGGLVAPGRAAGGVRIPNAIGLVGVTLRTAFVVLDPAMRSGVGPMSNTVLVEIDR